MKYYSLFFSIILFASCSKRLSEVSIYCNLKEGDSISVALYSKINGYYTVVNGVTITSIDAIRNRVDIPLPDSLAQNIPAFSITIHHCSDSILAISRIRLKGYATFYPKDIINTLWWQTELMFEFDPKSNTIKSRINRNIPGTFPVGIAALYRYKYRPDGFQLFQRISLLVTLLVLIIVFYKQTSTQRFILFVIALFLASIPLKIDYNNYATAFMILTVLIVFIQEKSKQFSWQPIFYLLCVMYLMDLIGLSYTGDFYSGFKRLDRGILLVIFPLIFSMVQFKQKNVILLLRFFVWLVIAFCTFGLLSYATIVPELTWDMIFKDSKQYASFLMMWPAHLHPSYLSTIVLMAVPVVLYLNSFQFSVFSFQFRVFSFKFSVSSSKFKIMETILGISLPIVFTILAGARVGMVITPVLLLLGYLFYCKFKPVIKWGLVVAGIAAGGILIHLFPKADDRFVDPIRMDLRRIAISAIKEKPFFGWGTGYSKTLIHSEERAHSLGIETPYDFNQFHNQYLEDMVQFGIPGILILLVLFGWMLWIGIREKNFLLLSLLTIYTLFCWTESALYVSKGVLPFSFWLCFLMSNRKWTTNDADLTDIRRFQKSVFYYE